MKLNLRFASDVGTVSLTLDKQFAPSEVENITSFLSAMIGGSNMADFGHAMAAAEIVSAKEYRLEFSASDINNKIGTIKIVRHHTGLGLRESKDIVEGLMKMPTTNATGLKVLTRDLDCAGITSYRIVEVPVQG